MANRFDDLANALGSSERTGNSISGGGAKAQHDGQVDGINSAEDRTNLSMKMAVIALQQSRVAMMNSTRSAPIRTDSTINNVIESTKRDYNGKTQGQKNHGMGTPDHWVGVKVFMKLYKDLTERIEAAKRAQGSGGNPTTTEILLKDKLHAFLSDCGTLPSKFAQRRIKTFRTEKMFSPATKRLTIKLRDTELEDALLDYLEDNDKACAEWHGMRPAGWLEQRAQQHLMKIPKFTVD